MLYELTLGSLAVFLALLLALIFFIYYTTKLEHYILLGMGATLFVIGLILVPLLAVDANEGCQTVITQNSTQTTITEECQSTNAYVAGIYKGYIYVLGATGTYFILWLLYKAYLHFLNEIKKRRKFR